MRGNYFFVGNFFGPGRNFFPTGKKFPRSWPAGLGAGGLWPGAWPGHALVLRPLRRDKTGVKRLAGGPVPAVASLTVSNDQLAAPFPPIRQLGPDDQGRCVALSIDRGWLPERAKWGLLLAASEVFGIDAPDGRGLAGAVVLTRYGTDLASVGMMLVAARYERRGLGRALMEHLLRAAGDDTTVTLFATSLGRPLYEKLGFVPVRHSAAFVGQFRPTQPDNSKKREAPAGPPAWTATAPAPGTPAAALGTPAAATPEQAPVAGAGTSVLAPDAPPAPGGIRAAAPADLPAILDLDRAAFGADRSHVLLRVAALADRIAVAGEDGAVTGYAIAWRNDVTSTVIGPLVAPDGATAKRLVADLAGHASTPVRLDLDPDRPELPGWAEARGLALGGVTLVMAHGALPRRGAPACLFTPVSVALA